MTESCRICNCIEPLLLALACTEAMEHNVVGGRETKSIGRDVKRLVSKAEYDELFSNHNWLEYPITEPLAEVALAISLRDITEKCRVPTKEIRALFNQATKANEKGQFGAAQQQFIEVKTKLLNLAKELCEET